MTIALVASAKGFGGITSGSGTTPAADTSTADFIVTGIGTSGGTPQVTNSKGDTYSLTTTEQYETVEAEREQMFYKSAPTVGSGHTWSTNLFYETVIAAAFSGVASSSALDGQNGAKNASAASSLAAGSVTPSVNGCLVITFVAIADAANTITAPSGFTPIESTAGASGKQCALAYQIQTTATAVNPSWGFGSACRGAATVAVFKPAASAPVLSSPTGAATGNTTANAGATIDTVSGSGSRIMYALPRVGGSQASSATIIATGTQLAVTSSGAKLVPLTGLTTNVGAVADVVYVDATLGTSNVVTTGTFTPSTLAWSGTYPNQSGVAGAAFTHSGTIPTPTGGIGSKTYSATGLGASGLTVNTSTGQLQGTCGTAGTYTITPTVTDSSTAGTNPSGGGSPPQTITLASFTLTISAAGSPPTVSANPTNLTVTSGSTASLSGGFNGTPTLSLQWQEFIGGVWTAMSGQTSATLSLGAVTLVDTGRLFRLGCTNAYGGPIYTASATLTVTAATVGTITSDVLADWGNSTPLASLSIPFVTIEKVSDANIALQLTNQITGTNGKLVITNAAIVTGTDYMLALRDAAGAVRGYKKYRAT